MPSTQFTNSVAANVAFWRRLTDNGSRENRRRLEDDRHNLFKAAEFGIGLSGTWRETAELLLDLRDLFDHGIYWIEWIPVLEGVIARCDAADLVLKCRLLNLVGFQYRTSRELEVASSRLLEAEKIAVNLQEKRLLARSHIELSRLHLAQRDHEEAQITALKALAEYEALGSDPRMIGSCYLNIGLSAHARGQPDKAEENLRESVRLFSTASDPINLARACLDLAIILDASGKSEEALATYQQAESLLAQTGSELDKTMVQLSLGTLYFRQDRLDLAEAAYLQANSLFLRQSGHQYHQAMAANNLGSVYLAQGRLEKAESWLEAAVRLWREAGAGLMLANTLGDMAQVKIAQGHAAIATSLYDEAIAISEAYQNDAWGQSMKQQFVESRAALAG
jgi:tetratricopeptide (TPR) repeat protein